MGRSGCYFRLFCSTLGVRCSYLFFRREVFNVLRSHFLGCGRGRRAKRGGIWSRVFRAPGRDGFAPGWSPWIPWRVAGHGAIGD